MSATLASQQPRILMFVPQYPFPVIGGLERQSHELSKALLRMNIKVTVISGKIDANGQDREVVEGVAVIRLPWSKNKLLRSLFSTLFLSWHMLRIRDQYDIAHIHNISWVGGIVLILAKLLRKKTLVKLPNVGEFGIPGIQKKTLGNLLMAVFKRSDVLIALSNNSAEEISSTGYPKQKILKITNGVSLSDFTSTDTKRADNNSVKVLFSGRLSPEKGIFDLLTAWVSVLKDLQQPAALEICGDGPLKQQILDAIEEKNIASTVTLHGHVKNIKAMLGDADIFVLPSYFEGNSNAILEAMSSGLPIVSTDVGGTLTMVGAKGAEFICQPGDCETLAKNISALIADTERRQVFGKMMRDRVTDFFAIDAISKKYLDVYNHLHRAGKNSSAADFSSPVFEETT